MCEIFVRMYNPSTSDEEISRSRHDNVILMTMVIGPSLHAVSSIENSRPIIRALMNAENLRLNMQLCLQLTSP